MIVVLSLGIFVARASVAELELLKNAGLFEQLYRAIDCCQRDLGIDTGGAGVEFFHVRMILGLFQHGGDRAPLAGEAQALCFAAFQNCVGHRGLIPRCPGDRGFGRARKPISRE